MKKLQVALLVTIASAVMLAGCGKDTTPVTGSDAEIIESAVTSTEDTEATEATDTTTEIDKEVFDDVPPEEGMVRSKITNEWIDAELYDQRPLAVMIPNESSAIPH